MSLEWLAIIPILSLLMLVHEWGHFVTARRAGITVQEFGFGLPPRLIGIERGGVIYSLNAIPFGAFVKMLGEEDPTQPGSFARQSKRVRAIVLAAGSGMNFITAGVVFSIAYMSGWPTPVENEVEIGQVVSGTPAEQAGIRPGDQVLAINGEAITRVDDFRARTQQSLGQPMRVELQRDGQQVTVTMTPREYPPEGQGAVGVALRAPVRSTNHGFLESIGLGFMRAIQIVRFTLEAPVMAIQGVISPDMLRPIGLPGMAQVAAQAVDYATDTGAWFPILTVTGTFSAGLAVANMLPLPALDGGRLLFIAIEAVRGRRVSPEREGMFHFVGIVLLITLMVLISINDVVAPLPVIDWGGR